MKIFKWIVGFGGVFLGLYLLNPQGYSNPDIEQDPYEAFGRFIISLIVWVATFFIVKAIHEESKK